LLSKPCKFCQIVIRRAGVKHVYYTIDQGHVGWWNVKRNEWTIVKTELKQLKSER